MQRRTKLGFGAVAAAAALLLTSSASSVAQPEPENSVVIQLELDGVSHGQWNQCLGLGDATEIVEVQETTPDGGVVIRKIPGGHRQHELVCTRPMSDDLTLAEWREDVVGDPAEARKNGSIVLYGLEGEEITRFTFTNAWPSELIYVPDPSVGLTESVTIVVETLERS